MNVLTGREATSGSSIRWFNGCWCSQNIEVWRDIHVSCNERIAERQSEWISAI